MNQSEYLEIQKRLSSKMKNPKYPTNRESAYNDGILAAKSIISDIYRRNKEVLTNK